MTQQHLIYAALGGIVLLTMHAKGYLAGLIPAARTGAAATLPNKVAQVEPSNPNALGMLWAQTVRAEVQAEHDAALLAEVRKTIKEKIAGPFVPPEPAPPAA